MGCLARKMDRAIPTLPGRHRVGYLGWLGYRNLGDDALFDASRVLLPDTNLRPVPVSGAALDATAGVPWRTMRAVLLGGGTLIGTRTYREALDRYAAARRPPLAFHVLGAGVEDPRAPRNGAEIGAELARWRETLQRFDGVSVRGPRSRALLEEIGVSCKEVGDPALVLGEGRPAERDPERILGLNLGMTSALWGDDPEAVRDAVIAAARLLRADGWNLRWFSFWASDLEMVRDAAGRAGGPVDVVDSAQGLGHVLDAMRGCRVFVGLKLHAVVLASALWIPSLMLEYRGKCRDFQASLGREEFTIRTDALRSTALVEVVQRFDFEHAAHREQLRSAVEERRGRLRAEAERIETAIATR